MELRRFDRFWVYRVGWKPANEVVFEADTFFFSCLQTSPFAEAYEAFKNTENSSKGYWPQLGKRHSLTILWRRSWRRQSLTKVNPVESTPGVQTLRTTKLARWLHEQLEGKTEGELQLYLLAMLLTKYCWQRCYLPIDVRHYSNIYRYLHMTPKNMWRTSPPHDTVRPSWWWSLLRKTIQTPYGNIIRDLSTCYPDVITNVQYDLPVINVVFSNGKYASSWHTNKHFVCCDFLMLTMRKSLKLKVP